MMMKRQIGQASAALACVVLGMMVLHIPAWLVLVLVLAGYGVAKIVRVQRKGRGTP